MSDEGWESRMSERATRRARERAMSDAAIEAEWEAERVRLGLPPERELRSSFREFVPDSGVGASIADGDSGDLVVGGLAPRWDGVVTRVEQDSRRGASIRFRGPGHFQVAPMDVVVHEGETFVVEWKVVAE